jgi:protein-S-isoprenylcysteine O-methyltransferase Ste14
MNIVFDVIQNFDPSIMLGISIAIFTVLISVAIAVFQDRKEFEDLDRHVILKGIVKAQCLICCLVLIFLPLLTWKILPYSFRIAGFFSWMLGIGFMVLVLIQS